MKKILTFVIALALIAALGCVALTSCSFVKVNEERQANSVIATVKGDVGGQDVTLTVTRNELISYVNYLINLYSQYNLSYDAKTIMSSGLNSLIKQKYQIIEGMSYLKSCADKNPERKNALFMNTNEYKTLYGDNTTISAEGLLTVAERCAAIAETNDTFISSVDGYKTDYEDTQREMAITAVKEEMAASYSNGYSVKLDADDEPLVAIYYKNADGAYVQGLPKQYYSSDSDVVYTDIVMKITLTNGTDSKDYYYLLADSAFSTADGTVDDLADTDTEKKALINDYANYFSVKVATATYDEPTGTDDDGNTKYTTRTAKTAYLVAKSRTAYTAPTAEQTTEKTTKAREDALKTSRYYTWAQLTDDAATDEIKAFAAEGKFFEHSKNTTDPAEKDALRQFRESKKTALVNFDETSGAKYNGLGYYYLSGFESAVLTAVQYEKGKEQPAVTDADVSAEYTTLVNKQKEEYDVLSYADQVSKFATAIGSSLATTYYIPVEALKNTYYDTGADYAADKTADANDLNYELGAEIKAGDPIYRAYATEKNGALTIDIFYVAHVLTKFDTKFINAYKPYTQYDETKNKEIILNIADDMLRILEGNPEYLTEGKFDTLGDMYKVESDALATTTFNNLLAELKTALDGAEDKVAAFKEYMVKFNDDGGKMSNDLGYMVAMGDKISLSWTEGFTKAAQDLYQYALDTDAASAQGAYTVNAAGDLSYGLVESSSYSGIHTEMISYAPFYKMAMGTDLLSDGIVNIGTVDAPVYCFGLNKELTLVTGDDSITQYKTVKDALQSKRTSTVYSKWSSSIESKTALSHSDIDTKRLKKLVKDLGLDK